MCKIVGISYRQLDYWARTGLVTPSIREAGGSGTQRLYRADPQAMTDLRALLETFWDESLEQVRSAAENAATFQREPRRQA